MIPNSVGRCNCSLFAAPLLSALVMMTVIEVSLATFEANRGATHCDRLSVEEGGFVVPSDFITYRIHSYLTVCINLGEGE